MVIYVTYMVLYGAHMIVYDACLINYDIFMIFIWRITVSNATRFSTVQGKVVKTSLMCQQMVHAYLPLDYGNVRCMCGSI